MKDYVSLVSIPEFVIKLLKQETVIVPEQLLDSIEPTLLDSLFPFQREGKIQIMFTENLLTFLIRNRCSVWNKSGWQISSRR